MRKSTRDRAQGTSLVAAPTAAIVRIGNAAFERGSVGIDVLTRDRQAQAIKVAESRETGRGEGSVEQVEVFLMVSVRTSILGDLDVYPDTPVLTPPTPSTATLL
jgi:hypothetical protein